MMTESQSVLTIIGANIRAERARAHLTQEDLAHRADLHPTQLARMERGEVGYSIVKLVAVAKALAVEPSEFFRGI